jgi:hypothetical protein
MDTTPGQAGFLHGYDLRHSLTAPKYVVDDDVASITADSAANAADDDAIRSGKITEDEFNAFQETYPNSILEDGDVYLLQCGCKLKNGQTCGRTAKARAGKFETPFLSINGFRIKGHKHDREQLASDADKDWIVIKSKVSLVDVRNPMNHTFLKSINVCTEFGSVSYYAWLEKGAPHPRGMESIDVISYHI